LQSSEAQSVMSEIEKEARLYIIKPLDKWVVKRRGA
jgi:hypothetical protein